MRWSPPPCCGAELAHERIGGDVSRLELLTERPALLLRLQFGKHKGESFRDVPSSYLEWMKRTITDDDDLAHTVRSALQGRFA